MSTPEPLDETPAHGVEIRGGNRPEDYAGPPPSSCACCEITPELPDDEDPE